MIINNFTVFNIQRYAIHDGDGIRTSIFFKGCPLRCAWCHNPESQNYLPELIYHAERCIGCELCQELCPYGAISYAQTSGRNPTPIAVTDHERCTACGSCTESCPAAAREIAGKNYTVTELVKIVEQDRPFYEESGGGVTLSGGEPLARDISGVEALLSECKRRGISTAVDTCGYVPWEHFERVLPFTDLFLYDVKMLDSTGHKQYTGIDNDLILDNLCHLSKCGAMIDIRVPVIGGVNDTNAEMSAIADFLKKNVTPRRIHLLPYHNTGSAKFQKLDRVYPGSAFYVPDAEYMETTRQQFVKHGFTSVIGG